MADVQIENGYTRIANDLLENLAGIKLSPTQYRIIFLVWRYTYGFKRKEHEMSLSFLSKATGIDKRNIQRELKSLEERKVIHQEVKSGIYRKVSFNKNFDEWVGKITIGETTIGEITNGETNNARVGETNNTNIGEIDNTTIGETNNQERNIKENFKENIKERFNEFWSLYPKKVKKEDALKRYKTHIKTQKEHEKVISGLKSYLKEIETSNTQKQYILHPSTFLNQKKYLDEFEEEEIKPKFVLSEKMKLKTRLTELDGILSLGVDYFENKEEFYSAEREYEEIEQRLQQG